jgi:lipopolysaccharide transport system ATP-binding protein
MTEAAITIKNLSKRYPLRAAPKGITLRETLREGWRSSSGRQAAREFEALKSLSFSVAPGERLGIIGQNGAGKSTLLKIISRITPPSSGEVVLNGRVASLLEVGTGFHQELTGRENIFLNGSILGMKRREISSRLEEIIDFSGVAPFIDQPLKKYSSGMQLRLAFAVAAHLDPEILLIDEVLAVGDLEFQKKCLGKMEEVSRRQGRTLLFVSHNLAAIRQLCTRAVVLQQGELAFTGTPSEAVAFYSAGGDASAPQEEQHLISLSSHLGKKREGEGLLQARIFVNGAPSPVFVPGADLRIELEYRLNAPLVNPEVGLVVKDSEGFPLLGLNNRHLGKPLRLRTGSTATVTIDIPAFNLVRPGKYGVDLFFGDPGDFFESLYEAFSFTVRPEDVYHSGLLLDPAWNQVFIPNLDINAE